MLVHISVLVHTFSHKINTTDFCFKESVLPRNFIHTVFMYFGLPVNSYFIWIPKYSVDQKEKFTLRMIVLSKVNQTLICVLFEGRYRIVWILYYLSLRSSFPGNLELPAYMAIIPCQVWDKLLGNLNDFKKCISLI